MKKSTYSTYLCSAGIIFHFLHLLKLDFIVLNCLEISVYYWIVRELNCILTIYTNIQSHCFQKETED